MEEGYDGDDLDLIAAEGAAKLLAGQALGLEAPASVEFLQEYGQLLDQQHGDGTAKEVFRFVHESIRELFHEEETGSVANVKTLANRFEQILKASPEEGARLVFSRRDTLTAPALRGAELIAEGANRHLPGTGHPCGCACLDNSAIRV